MERTAIHGPKGLGEGTEEFLPAEYDKQGVCRNACFVSGCIFGIVLAIGFIWVLASGITWFWANPLL